jgi:ligand-binding sensor domain-containing protein
MLAIAAALVVHTDTREVRACAVLDDGALVGTGGGLMRVDLRGRQTTLWTSADGLPGTRIEAVVRDGADDGWWIGADDGGAKVRLVAGKLVVDRRVVVDGGGAMHDVVRHGGVLYAATSKGVVKLGHGENGVVVPFKGGVSGAKAARLRVAAVASADGALWAGTAAGLFVMRGGQLEHVALPGAHASAGVTSLHADDPSLWIATSDGLFVRDPDGVRRIGEGDLRKVAKVGGDVVVAGLGSGLQKVDRGRLVRLEGAPRGMSLMQAVSEHDGGACAGGLDGLWIRPKFGALWMAAPAAPGAGLPSNDVSALAVEGGRLWVGTFDKGLAVRDGGTWQVVAHPDLDGRVNAILVEPRAGNPARVWVGTAAGLMSLDGVDAKDGVAQNVTRLTRRDGLPGRSVMSLARLRDGRIIAGTSTGAVIVDGGRAVPVGPAGTDIGNVWAVGEDADGMLWLGTTTGVWRGPSNVEGKVDRGTAWTRLSVASGHLRVDWVMAIVAHDRSVFVGGYKGGVVRFDLDGTGGRVGMTATRIGDGWVNPSGMAWDAGKLFVSTQEGLRIGDGTDAGAWKTTGGLPGKDVTATVRIGDVRWIATRRGLVEMSR